jgi:hypothetical protein
MWIALSVLLVAVAIVAVILTSASLRGEKPFEYQHIVPFHGDRARSILGIVEDAKRKWLMGSLWLVVVSILSSAFSVLLRPNWLSRILLACGLVAYLSVLFLPQLIWEVR